MNKAAADSLLSTEPGRTPSEADAPITPARLTLMAVFLVLIWGSAFTMVGVAVKYVSPIWLVAYRLTIGAIFVTGYAHYRGRRFPPLRDVRWRYYFLFGITGSLLPFFLLSTGQLTVDSGLTAVLTGAMPLITIILAHFFTDERLTFFKLAGFVIGFMGIVILFMPNDLSFNLVGDWKAQSLILAAAACYAFTTVFVKRAPHVPASLGAAMMLTCAAISALICAFLTEVPTSFPHPTAMLMALGLGLGSSGTANIVYLYVIEKTGPTTLARINYLTPIASVGLGVWLLSEPLTPRLLAAFPVIIIGIMISRIGSKKSKPAKLK
ncbi:MAG: DMT family transporter [Maricaulaceae bacterium]